MVHLWLATLITLLPYSTHLTGAVSLGRLDVLSRDQLLRLDREVSIYYNESYSELDQREHPAVSYDEQLHRSMRAIRHTVVLNLFDYKYTRNETKWNSMGARVDKELCRKQLRQLAQIAERTQTSQSHEPPLSIVDFLDSNGKAGASVLNGNFVWLGSYSSCLRAKIPGWLWRKYLGIPADSSEASGAGSTELQQVPGDDINGRYCVAHLRAKSWPKWDDYFEDRLTLKRGICLPDTCHSAVYENDTEMEQLVDFLARFDLPAPFSNDDRYETSALYCLPDEDSPHRQMDLGAQAFIVFVIGWILLTIYTNVKYYRRLNAMQKLRDTVDIRMIINEKLDDIAMNYRDEDDEDGDDEAIAAGRGKMPPPKVRPVLDQLELGGGGNSNLLSGDRSGASSAASSAVSTPLPSGIDEDDSDNTYNLINPFSMRKRRRKRASKANANYNYGAKEDGNQGAAGQSSDSLDFVRAFSFEANLNFLFRPRPTDESPKNQHRQQQQQQQQASHFKSGSQQLASVRRRSSNLNETLVKDLNDQSGEQTGKVAIVSQSGKDSSQATRPGGGQQQQTDKGAADSQTGGQDAPMSRVDIDVLDGLKVIATSWIVWGHTMMFFFGLVVDLRFGSERMFDITMLTTINTLQVVGIFYIITGCLLTYFSFNKAKLKQLLNPAFWLLVLVGRYIRLIPAYALVFWFARHVAPHTGVGPGFYDYRTDDEHARGACAHESWWVMWTMSAADIKIPLDCIPQAWYLSDDFRTLLVLPVYVLLLAKSTLLGYSAILATFAYSAHRLAQILLVAKIDYCILLAWQPHVYSLMADRLHEVYTNPAVRMSTYLLGVIVGHLLYMYEQRQIKQWPGWFRRWGMKVALLLACCFFLGAPLLASPLINQFLPGREQIDSTAVVWLIPMFKGVMELSICAIILLLVTGGGFSFVRRILASQAMKILSNLSYAVFLTHVEIMYKLPAHQLDSDYWHLFKHVIFFIILAHVVAFFLHLFFEMPVHFMTRHLFKKVFKLIS